MTAKEIRELSVSEISTKLRETRELLLQLRLRKQTGQVEKPHLLRTYRKDIARLETVLTMKKKQIPTVSNIYVPPNTKPMALITFLRN
jgi:large subunit ribosomal protein L29